MILEDFRLILLLALHATRAVRFVHVLGSIPRLMVPEAVEGKCITPHHRFFLISRRHSTPGRLFHDKVDPIFARKPHQARRVTHSSPISLLKSY